MERIAIKVTWWTWCVPGSRRVRHHSWICRRNQPSPRSVAGPHPDWWPWRYGESGEVAPAPTDRKFTRCINLNQTNSTTCLNNRIIQRILKISDLTFSFSWLQTDIWYSKKKCYLQIVKIQNFFFKLNII